MKTETPKKIAPVCLIRGGQSLLADRFVREISSRFLGSASPENVSVFYADQTPLAEVISGASNLAMFSSKKVIVLKRAETLDKKSLETLKKYAARPARHALVILVSDQHSKPDIKSAEGIFIKTVDESAQKIHERVISEAKIFGISMRRDASAHLCELVGEDLNVIKNELAKLAEIHGEGAGISRKDIARMFARRKSRDVFELTNTVADGRKSEALAILAEIAAQNKIEPLLILSAVSSRIRNILRAAEIVAKSPKIPAEQQKNLIAKNLKIKPGAAHFLWKQSRNFPPEKAARIMKNFAETDRALKTSRSGSYGAIAKMTVNLTAKH